MPLQGSGQINISDINAELGLSNSDSSLAALSGAANNTDPCNLANLPGSNSAPHAMSEFYAYDHNCTSAEPNEYYWDFQEDSNGTRYTANTPSESAAESMSFSMWVRPSWAAIDINALMFDILFDASNRFFLIYDYGLNRFVWRYRSAGQNFDRQWAMSGNSAVTGTSGNWHGGNRGSTNADGFVHLAGSYDASQSNASNAFKLYWNGQEMSNQVVANSNTRSDFTKQFLFIDVNGANTNADRDAEFDNVAFWRGRILSATDIQALYNSGTPATAAYVNQASGLDFEATYEGGDPADTTGNWQLDYAGGNPVTY